METKYNFKNVKNIEDFLNEIGVNVDIEQKNAAQSPSNLPKVIWEGLVA